MQNKIDTNSGFANTDLQIIAIALKRDRNMKVTIGCCLVIASLTFMAINTGVSSFSEKSIYAIVMLCMLMGFAGLYFLLQGVLRYDMQKNFILKLIAKYPYKVVWVYYNKVENFPFGIKFLKFNYLYICLTNSDRICLQMPEKQVRLLMPLLRKRLYNATFGYSTQKAQLYNIAPDLLSKNALHEE